MPQIDAAISMPAPTDSLLIWRSRRAMMLLAA
jgi:hypothetical protein